MKRAIFLAILASFASAGFAQDSITVTSNPELTARPISALLQQLREHERIPVTYEDPRYSKRSDMDEKLLTFSYSQRDLRNVDGAETIVARMLREYGRVGGLTFTVVKDGPRLHVVPNETFNTVGERIRQDSLLDTVVNVLPRERSGNQLLQEICNQIKERTGYRIDIGPGNPGLDNYRTAIGIENLSARAAFEKVWDGASSPGSLVWDLLYDPVDGSYGLNFVYVGLAGAPPKKRPK